MLIRHNIRGDSDGKHWAHDSTRADLEGCRVAGSSRTVYTSRSRPCPQCHGWGALVEMRKLDRTLYPKGASLRVDHLTNPYQAGPVSGWEAGEGADADGVNPMPAPVEPEPVSEPVPSVPANVPEPAVSASPDANAGQAMADLFGNMIAQAIQSATANAQADQATTIAQAIESLEAKFQATVEALVVPQTIMVDRGDGNPPVQIDGTVHSAFERVLKWLNARDHENHPRNVFLTGPAGSGKTTLAKQVAQALGMSDRFTTTGQIISEFQVTGFVGAGGEYHTTAFRQVFEHGGVWLGDEFDAWSPEAALALNGALANGEATFPDSPFPVKRHPEAFFLVAGNTWGEGADLEYVGRNVMDKASLSRFITIPVGYDKALETQIAGTFTEIRDLIWKVRAKADELKLQEMFGTRELIHCVCGLRDGIRFDEVVSTVLKRNMGQAQWEKVAS